MLNVLMKTFYRSFPLLITLILINSAAHAADLSPLGLWKTIDDYRRARGLVRIREVNRTVRRQN